jgi:hypothetical protein
MRSDPGPMVGSGFCRACPLYEPPQDHPCTTNCGVLWPRCALPRGTATFSWNRARVPELLPLDREPLLICEPCRALHPCPADAPLPAHVCETAGSSVPPLCDHRRAEESSRKGCQRPGSLPAGVRESPPAGSVPLYQLCQDQGEHRRPGLAQGLDIGNGPSYVRRLCGLGKDVCACKVVMRR